MKNKLVQARISEKLQKDAELVFDSIGITASEAIRLFFKQCVNSRGLPFQPMMRIPNKETQKAIHDVEACNDEAKRYDSFKDLLDDHNIE